MFFFIQDIPNTINLETQATDEPSETQNIKDIDINDVDTCLEYDESEVNDVNIMGKVFNTRYNAYSFYNRYVFLHGFDIWIH